MSMDTADAGPTAHRWLLFLATIALLHSALFIYYQKPDWNRKDAWTDQAGYSRLGHVVATTGKFTRYPDERPFIPETLRTPGYPFFVGAVYAVFGESRAAVAAVQGGLFAMEAIAIYFLTTRLASFRIARATSLATALYSPLPYFGALTLTEALTAFLVTIGIWRAVLAVQRGRRADFLITGLVLGAAALTRPTFVLFPFFLIAAAAVAERYAWRRLAGWGLTVAVFATVIAPWLAYNAIYVHRITMSPAGGLGRGVWESSWQGTWRSQVQAGLTTIAQNTWDERVGADQVERTVRSYAATHQLDPEMMVTYVRQWQDIRRMWDTSSGPRARGLERIAADDEYWRMGVENIRRDVSAYLVRRLPYRMFILWAGDIPIRYSDINFTPRIIIRAMWLLQAVLVTLALWGIVVLVGRGHGRPAALLAAVIAYLTLIHLAILTESRYSLPAKPVMVMLAVIAIAELTHRMLPQTGDLL